MFDLLINELVYFILVAAILFFVSLLPKKENRLKKTIAIALVLVSAHFLISFTLTLLSIYDIWFPFFLDITSDFPKPKHDYDIKNLILFLAVVYSINLLTLVWGLIVLLRKR